MAESLGPILAQSYRVEKIKSSTTRECRKITTFFFLFMFIYYNESLVSPLDSIPVVGNLFRISGTHLKISKSFTGRAG